MNGDASEPVTDGVAFDLNRSMAEAQAALAAGKLDEVERLCKLVLVHEKVFPPATFFLAIVASNRGNRRLAMDLLKDVIQKNPHAFEAIEWLANLHREQGEFEDSMRLCEQMNRLRPSHPGALALMGMCSLDQGLPVEALSYFQKAVAKAPAASPFHFHLARTLEQLLRFKEAESEYRQAIGLDPGIAMFHQSLGKMLFLNGRREDGIQCLRQAARLDPAPGTLLLLASGLTEVGRHEEAVKYFNRSIELDRSLADPHALLGYALQVLGRFEEAEASLRRAIELDPTVARAYLAITGSRSFTESDLPFLATMEKLADDDTRPKDDLRQLNYALGKAYADLGRYRESMERYDRANELSFDVQLKHVAFDLKAQRAWIDRLERTFTKEYFRKHLDLGSSSERPVFVVGMIRSATTLVDQILSSHPQIRSADELIFWTDPDRISLVQKLMDGLLPRSELKAAVAQHLSQLEMAAPGMPRVVDKMPRNYLALGIIHLLLPNARIVHCRRDPVDTCLSIYTTPFGKGAEFCYSRQSIVDAYREYLRVMEHWRRVIPPERFLEVDYEELVENEELVARRMVSYCGLDWDDACLRPERNERPVNTPSLWQVRQPVYKTSVRRSAQYEPWLREFATLRQVS